MARLLSRCFRARSGRTRWWAVALLFVAVLPTATGCYGKFPATREVYRFNGEATEYPFVQTLIMWGLSPVYAIAVVADSLVLNLIEFWSDETVDFSFQRSHDGTTFAVVPSADGREAVLTISRDGETIGTATVRRVSADRYEVRDADGNLTRRVERTPDGRLRLTDADGTLLRTRPAKAPAS